MLCIAEIKCSEKHLFSWLRRALLKQWIVYLIFSISLRKTPNLCLQYISHVTKLIFFGGIYHLFLPVRRFTEITEITTEITEITTNIILLGPIYIVVSAGYHDLPKQTETNRNGPKRTYENTETDFYGYRNGPERTSVGTEKDWNSLQLIPKRT